MTFQVNEHLTKVIGPATLEISKTEQNGIEEFFINIIEGQFVEIEAEKPSESLTITKDNIAVHHNQQTETLKLQIVEQDGKTQVKNMGDAIQINTEDKQHKIEKQQIASISQQTQEITIDDDNAVTITIGTGENSTDQESTISQPTWKKIVAVLDQSTPEQQNTPKEKINSDQKTDKKIDTEKAIVLSEDQMDNEQVKTSANIQKTAPKKEVKQLTQIDGKQIPNEEQVKQLHALLQKSFLDYDVRSLIASIVYDKPNGKQITINNINNRLITL